MRTTPRALVLGLLTALALVTLTACGGLIESITGNTSVFSLEVGQCINQNIEGDSVSSIPVVDCAEAHTGEIYALPQVADGEFPGEQALGTQAEQECTGPAFQSYVGMPYQDSAIYANTLLPTSESWASGDREIVCYLQDQNGAELTGSLRGANR